MPQRSAEWCLRHRALAGRGAEAARAAPPRRSFAGAAPTRVPRASASARGSSSSCSWRTGRALRGRLWCCRSASRPTRGRAATRPRRRRAYVQSVTCPIWVRPPFFSTAISRGVRGCQRASVPSWCLPLLSAPLGGGGRVLCRKRRGSDLGALAVCAGVIFRPGWTASQNLLTRTPASPRMSRRPLGAQSYCSCTTR